MAPSSLCQRLAMLSWCTVGAEWGPRLSSWARWRGHPTGFCQRGLDSSVTYLSSSGGGHRAQENISLEEEVSLP